MKCVSDRARGRGIKMEVKEEREDGDAEGEAPVQAMDEDAAFYTGILPVKEEPGIQPPPPPPGRPSRAVNHDGNTFFQQEI